MTDPITVVTWVWKGERDYTLEHALALHASIARHWSGPPLQFVAIVDGTKEAYTKGTPSGDVWVWPTPLEAQRLAHLKTPERKSFPSSYRRLWLFSPGAAYLLPGRVMNVDVDAVATGDWAHLFGGKRGHAEPGSGGHRQADFVGWRPRMKWGGEDRVAGGQWILRTGSRAAVWAEFVADPAKAIAAAKAAGFRGSDQAWLSYKLARCPRTAFWREGDGVYSVRDFLARDAQGRRVAERPDAPREKVLPKDARVVHFNGHLKPWHPEAVRTYPWVAEHWR